MTLIRYRDIADNQQPHLSFNYRMHVSDSGNMLFFAQCAREPATTMLRCLSWLCMFPGVLELAFRLPDNKRLQRRFRCDDTIGKVAAFLAHTGMDMQRHVIIRSFPRKV